MRRNNSMVKREMCLVNKGCFWSGQSERGEFTGEEPGRVTCDFTA